MCPLFFSFHLSAACGIEGRALAERDSTFGTLISAASAKKGSRYITFLAGVGMRTS